MLLSVRHASQRVICDVLDIYRPPITVMVASDYEPMRVTKRSSAEHRDVNMT
jgi:hypothetical protein